MRFGKLEFRPGWWASLVTLLLLGLLMSLGFWQLDRAEQKRALLAGYNTDRDATVIQLEPGLQSYRDFNYQIASAAGHYDPDRQFLLDNRTHNGRVGYHVLTPFVLRKSGAAVLVNRGWIPTNPDGSPGPAAVPEGEVTVNGESHIPSPPATMARSQVSETSRGYSSAWRKLASTWILTRPSGSCRENSRWTTCSSNSARSSSQACNPSKVGGTL